MSDYTERFKDRRSGKDRRDWDEFILKDRRSGKDRRSNKERRDSQLPFGGIERRKSKGSPQKEKNDTQQRKPKEPYYSLAEAAKKTDISQSQILEWIYQKRLNDAHIRRDSNGRRIFNEEDIKALFIIKKQEFRSK